MERELTILRRKVQELTQENLALRDINIKFQLENYKLQKRIERFEKSQDIAFEWSDANYDSNVEYLEEASTTEFPGLLEETHDAVAEGEETYSTKDFIEIDPEIQDESVIDAKVEDFPGNPATTMIPSRIKTRRTEDLECSSRALDDGDPNLEDIFGAEELSVLASRSLDPKHATKAVYTIASNKSVLEKLVSIQNIRSKDAFFVNKVLDVLFGREVLANSSARGQKCQSQSHLPPRPALDPVKLSICRHAFVHRLMSLKLSVDVFEERLKMFNNYVNFKIQNTRKLFLREHKKTLINDQ